MAKTYDPDQLWHLWKRLAAPPWQVWAMTVAFDPDTEDGYVIMDFDSAVADSYFIDRFTAHMQAPREVIVGGRDGDVEYSEARTVVPGDHDFFDHAIRAFSLAAVMPDGRSK